MNLAIVLDFTSLFFAGILAGIEIVIHYGLRRPAEVLDEASQNWRALVDHAERFHIVGVWAVIMTFAGFLTAVALKLTAR